MLKKNNLEDKIMLQELLTQSKEMSHEYCCTIVKIGEVKPIDGSDFLGQVMVEGRTIVVRKDEIKEGDVLFYVQNECQLNHDFLYINNQFEDKSMNYDNTIKGYINKNGRIRMIKLRGVLSMGYLFSVDSMKKWYPKFDLNLEEHIGEDFDTVNGELFVKAYVPYVKESQPRGNSNKKQKKLKAFDRLIPGKFMLHYDTQQLQRNMDRIKPEDMLSISTKIHGTSIVIGNVLVNKPKFGGLYEKVFNYLPKFLQFTYQDYDVIYSSRTVIKNKTINSNVGKGYYSVDVWEGYYNLLKDYIPKGVTIYGEIVGYISGSNKMIQKDYDYGCKPGENKLMIYRINYEDEEGKHEWNISEVYNYTVYHLINECGLKDKLMPIDILFHGTLSYLYPNLDIANHWNENVLEEMKNDVEHFGMEEYEPLCRNKVPREGICVRIDDDVIDECFKLKCINFLNRESKLMDNGEIDDIEMSERY